MQTTATFSPDDSFLMLKFNDNNVFRLWQDQLNAEDASKMKDQIKEVRDKLANKDSMDPEEIKKTVNELQQQSLKLFEMAYKKVRRSVLLLFSIDRIGSLSLVFSRIKNEHFLSMFLQMASERSGGESSSSGEQKSEDKKEEKQ